jgi:hypothetical protein
VLGVVIHRLRFLSYCQKINKAESTRSHLVVMPPSRSNALMQPQMAQTFLLSGKLGLRDQAAATLC